MKKVYEKVRGYRRGFLCSICDQTNHKYVREFTKEIIYSRGQCTTLVNELAPTLYTKYVKIYPFLVVASEISFLTTGVSLFPERAKLIFRRYEMELQKCVLEKNAKNKFNACKDFCSEFLLNRFTYLFDGDLDMVNLYADRFNETLGLYKNKGPKEMFQYTESLWNGDFFKQYKENYSVLLNSYKKFNRGIKQKDYKFDKDEYKQYYEYENNINTV